MERAPGGGFGIENFPRRTPETPEQRTRQQLRREVAEIHWSAENPLAREIAKKIERKIDLKEQIDQMQAHKDDITVRQPLKQLGIFLIKETTTNIEYTDPETGFSIKPGDKVVDLHMPPVPKDQRTLSAAKRSFELIVQYMQLHNIDPKYIVGITYERLARVSRLQGFTVVEASIPEDIRGRIKRVYQRFVEPGKKQKPMGGIMLCYQTKDAFMNRFAPPEPAEHRIF